MLMLGKLQETRSLSSSIARATDLTKMTTCETKMTVKPVTVLGQAYQACLIELQSVQQLVQLPVLANLFELYVMLLETVEGQFCLVIHENFQGLGNTMCIREQI
jgi:hypothetical protein